MVQQSEVLILEAEPRQLIQQFNGVFRIGHEAPALELLTYT